MNDRKAVIIYGAGRAGAQLIESLRKSHDYAPVAFIDDDESKKEQLSIILMYMVLRI